MQIYFMKKTFFFSFPPLSLAFSCKEEKQKDVGEYKKALKSHMKIENITSVHNYFMLHVTCSTKSQMTLCSSLPDMPIILGGGWAYALKGLIKYCKGQFGLRRGRAVFKKDLKMRC